MVFLFFFFSHGRSQWEETDVMKRRGDLSQLFILTLIIPVVVLPIKGLLGQAYTTVIPH